MAICPRSELTKLISPHVQDNPYLTNQIVSLMLDRYKYCEGTFEDYWLIGQLKDLFIFDFYLRSHSQTALIRPCLDYLKINNLDTHVKYELLGYHLLDLSTYFHKRITSDLNLIRIYVDRIDPSKDIKRPKYFRIIKQIKSSGLPERLKYGLDDKLNYRKKFI